MTAFVTGKTHRGESVTDRYLIEAGATKAADDGRGRPLATDLRTPGPLGHSDVSSNASSRRVSPRISRIQQEDDREIAEGRHMPGRATRDCPAPPAGACFVHYCLSLRD